MKEITISLNTIDKVKAFVADVANVDCDLDIMSGENHKYIIDAKSIMGIFSLDLSKNLVFVIHSDDAELIAKIENIIKPYLP